MSDQKLRHDEPDRLFDQYLGPVRPFVFDESVARVFNDMVSRSVPGYLEIVQLIGLWAMQFVPPAERLAPLRRFHAGLLPCGALILVEKVQPEPGPRGELVTAVYEDYKRAMGYSELAIARKRQALEQVLIPDSITEHEQRLSQVGFTAWTRWYQALGFVAWIAWRRSSGE